MKTIICGSRKGCSLNDLHAAIEQFLSLHGHITRVLCGCSEGVDTQGYEWARTKGIPVDHYPGAWKHVGRAAGPIRNQRMVADADAVLAMPGGAGTADTVRRAKVSGLIVCEYHPAEPR